MFIDKIKKKNEFNIVFNTGKLLKLNNMFIQYCKRSQSGTDKGTRYGVIASKKVGNSVKRNYAKRRLRALAPLIHDHGENNFDYILIAKKNLINTNFKSLNCELEKALIRIKMIEK